MPAATGAAGSFLLAQKMVQNSWLKVALLNFLVIALPGLYLRWFMVAAPAGFTYHYLLHAHSHVTLLGWLKRGGYRRFSFPRWL